MKLLTVQLPHDHNNFLFGDKHEGSALSSQAGWDKLCHAMNSEYDGCSNNHGYELGDDIEAIMSDDPRFGPEKLKEKLPLAQKKEAVKMRQPIKHLLEVKLQGNHCRKLHRFGDLMEDMCEELGVPYGTYSSKVTINDSKGRLMYKMFLTHGFKGINSSADDPIRREANKRLVLKRHLKYKAADCAVMVKGHAHKLLVSKPESELYLYDNGKKIKQGYTGWGQDEQFIHPDARFYGCSGSFLTLYGKDFSGYAEVFELDPVQLGFLVLVVRDKKIVELKPYYI